MAYVLVASRIAQLLARFIPTIGRGLGRVFRILPIPLPAIPRALPRIPVPKEVFAKPVVRRVVKTGIIAGGAGAIAGFGFETGREGFKQVSRVAESISRAIQSPIIIIILILIILFLVRRR